MKIEAKNIILHSLIIIFISCDIQVQKQSEQNISEEKRKVISKKEQKSYKGWWIYGDGIHLFKDEQTLQEYRLEFKNDNLQELQDLYLAVCEMEYFPMECLMRGKLKKEGPENEGILIVEYFEILYIQGCE